jgi:WD40 repeat protein
MRAWVAVAIVGCGGAAAMSSPPSESAPAPPASVASASASASTSAATHTVPPFVRARPPAYVASLGLKAFRTERDVNGLTLSGDGAWLAAGGLEQTWVWDAKTGEEIANLSDGYQPSKLTFADGHRLLATMSDNHARVRVVDLTTRTLLFDIVRKTEGYPSFALSSDGRVLAWEQEPIVHIVDVTSGKELAAINTPISNFGDLQLSPDGKTLYAARASTLRAIDVASGSVRWTVPCAPVPTLAIDRAGAVLAVAGDATLRLLATGDGKPVHVVPAPSSYETKALAFSPDGKRVGAGGNHDVGRIFDVATGALVGEVMVEEIVGPLVPTNDGAFTMWRSNVRRWTSGTPRMNEVLTDDHVGRVNALAATPDGKLLASAADDGRMVVWDLATQKGKLVMHRPTALVRSVAISRDGKYAAAGGRVHDAPGKSSNEVWFLEVWDLAANKRVLAATGTNHATVTALGFSDDGKQVIAADDEMTRAYALPSGNELWKRKHTSVGYRRSFLSGAVMLVVDEAKEKKPGEMWPAKTVKRIDVKSGAPIWSVDDGAWDFSVGGDRAAYGDGGHCVIVELATGKKLVTASGEGTGVGGLALSPDGKRCAFAYTRFNLFDNGNVREIARNFGGRVEDVAWAGSYAIVAGTMGIDLYDPSLK